MPKDESTARSGTSNALAARGTSDTSDAPLETFSFEKWESGFGSLGIKLLDLDLCRQGLGVAALFGLLCALFGGN